MINLAWYYGKTNKEEWREAVKFIEEKASKGDLIIANKYVFYYYSKRDDIVKIQLPDVSEQNRNELVNKLRDLSRAYRRIWFVSSHEPELQSLVLETLSNSISMRKKFLGIEVFLFDGVQR